MSFSFEWVAINKTAAKAKLLTEYMPDCVREFVTAAVSNLSDPPDPNAADPISVKAQGHLHSGTDWDVSNADIKVHRIQLLQAPPPAQPTAESGPTAPPPGPPLAA